MSKKTLRLIIALMSLAMTGLILFQVNWINNAVTVNETQFNQNVHEALSSVISNLERKEVYYTATKTISGNNRPYMYSQHDSNQFISDPGRNQFRNPDRQENKEQRFEWQTDFKMEDSILFGNQQIKISYEMKNESFPNFIDPSSQEGSVIHESIGININSVEEYNRIVQQNFEKLAQKSQMVTIVLDELLGQQKQISNRLDKVQLEKLIETELLDKGIDIEYEYAVIDKNRNQFMFASNSEDNDKNLVLQSDFSAKLFPNDIRGGENYLAVFFPNQNSYLLKQVGLPLASSILLALLIVSLFGYAIFAIIRQKKVSEIKNDFINNMTHEFKTPISTVALACEALQDQEIQKNKSFVGKYIQVINDENKRLGRQVEKVLQMATLDKKEFKLKYEELNIHEIINAALSNIEIQIKQKNGTITKRLIASNCIVVSDELHLSNIIYNLLDNANKYSLDNPDISIQTEDHHQGVLIRISDKGIGMSNEETDKIFDKFYRVPTGNIHDVKGFGLGLTYVKTIVTALGGHIKVKSDPGTGSTFEIILPLNNGKN